MPPPHRDLATLVERELTRDEFPGTSELMDDLRPARVRGYLTRQEFLACCRWKSPRSIRHCETNSPARVRRLSAQALATRDERARFEALLELDGVGVPTASAILTLIEPRRYGVIDIRVWQLLYALGEVRTKPGGSGFTCEDWLLFLGILRPHARRLRVGVRVVELSLFRYHRRHQDGRLYKT